DLGGVHPDLLPEHLQHFQGDGETGLSRNANAMGHRAVYQPKAVIYHCIPMSRMTLRYLQKRYFYQGVRDSYTRIRAVGRPSRNPVRKTPITVLKAALGALALPFRRGEISLKPEAAVRLSCDAAYQQGYRFHQQAVSHSPDLLDWVQRPDYW